MARGQCSTLIINILLPLIITVFVIMIIHPIMPANAAINRMCEADRQISNQKLNNISNMASVVLMQINDSRFATDPKYVTMQLKMANQSLGALIKILDIMDQDHTIAGTIQQINQAKDLINDNKPIQAANIIRNANRTAYEEAYKCPH
jgi:hypothetical protein